MYYNILLQNNQRYAFVFAFLSFFSLFFAVLHVESNTTANSTFIIIFITVGWYSSILINPFRKYFDWFWLVSGILFFFWLCLYSVYQVLYNNNQKQIAEAALSPTWSL